MQQYSIFFNHIPYSNQTLNEYKKTHPKRIYRSYTNPYKTDLDLNIYSGSYYCVNHGHDIEEVYIEVVDMIDGLKKTILVSHCKDCNKFFLAQNALEKYHKSGVFPRASFLLPYSGSTFDEFNKKSILKLYGYTVGVNGMSLSQRQTLLKSKRSIVSILTKKYLIASRQVLVCGNDPAVFLTKAIDLPENSDPCHPYDLGFLTANIQNNRMV